eukprot:755245-Hanusia_phi.AAC.1
MPLRAGPRCVTRRSASWGCQAAGKDKDTTADLVAAGDSPPPPPPPPPPPSIASTLQAGGGQVGKQQQEGPTLLLRAETVDSFLGRSLTRLPAETRQGRGGERRGREGERGEERRGSGRRERGGERERGEGKRERGKEEEGGGRRNLHRSLQAGIHSCLCRFPGKEDARVCIGVSDGRERKHEGGR